MLLAEGAGDKEIGSSLGITVRTASSHVAAVLGKLGVQSRGRAAAYAYRTGLVPPDATTDYSKRG